MNHKNPLMISPNIDKYTPNKRGRPSKRNITTFGPQPRSFISLILKEEKVKAQNVQLSDKTTQQNHNNIYNELSGKVQCNKIKDDIGDIQNCDNDDEDCKTYKSEPKTKHTCDFKNCNYSCELSSNLIKHKRTHFVEKPYLCDLCPFQSKFVNSLKTHKRIHTNEKPFNCTFCNYRCNSSSNLKKHCKHRHPNVK